MTKNRTSINVRSRSFAWVVLCKSGVLSTGRNTDFLTTIAVARIEKARWALLLPNSRLRVQLSYPNGANLSRADLQAALRALHNEKILTTVRDRVSAAVRGNGLGAAQAVTRTAAESAFLTDPARSIFSQAGVVAPPDGPDLGNSVDVSSVVVSV